MSVVFPGLLASDTPNTLSDDDPCSSTRIDGGASFEIRSVGFHPLLEDS